MDDVCKKCSGKGVIQPDHKDGEYKNCKACKGTGKRYMGGKKDGKTRRN